jgi:hypothetical protein
LNGHNVHVCFLSEKKLHEYTESDTVIYVTTASTNIIGQPSSQYVKLAHLLNDGGYALLTDTKQGFQILEANKLKSNKISLLEPLNAKDYPDSVLPKVIGKNLQNAYDTTYEAIISYVAKYERKKLTFYVQLIKITKAYEILVELRERLDKFYGTLVDDMEALRFPENYIMESIKKKQHLAGVCKFNEHFYRCSITKIIGSKFLVKLVDYGIKIQVEHENIFRPLQKYINLERQAFKMRLDGDYNQDEKPVINFLFIIIVMVDQMINFNGDFFPNCRFRKLTINKDIFSNFIFGFK